MKQNVLEYLEQTAAAYPDRLAADDGSCCLTWTELTSLSRRIGTALARKTVPGRPVVILMTKSTRTLAAMFGTVYAGCFYVMVDPAQPVMRMQRIFQVLQPELIVTDEKNRAVPAAIGYEKEVCIIDDLTAGHTDEAVLAQIRAQSSADDLLYGIFTSGSTGVPKGIVVSHRSVMDFIGHFTELFGITEGNRFGNQAPFDFDVSVKDIYSCVMTGASLILIPARLFSIPAELLDYICEKRVNTLVWAVSALTLVSALKGLRYRVPTDVKQVLFSGEVMPARQLREWQRALPDAEFVNLYGPSEITCNCTFYRILHEVEKDEKLPLGEAFPGRTVFLLDEEDHIFTDPGKNGEICVAGESLAAGYYRNPEETAARFVEPASGILPERFYRTGDLAYYGDDGELYFAGRKDFQIKHMGHRIELEEIERALDQTEGIEKSCCVMYAKRNQLVAFYMGTADEQEIRSSLSKSVPAYMIPHRFIHIEQMPLTKNGKTDRNRLLEQL